MRLIHQAHNNSTMSSVIRSQLLPQAREIIIGRSTRSTNNTPVPASVIVDINYAMRACRQAGLHQLVVLSEIRGVERAAELVVDEILPCYGEPEDVKFVVHGEVVHLPRAIAAAICPQWWVDT